jgi:hypothetical protein
MQYIINYVSYCDSTMLNTYGLTANQNHTAKGMGYCCCDIFRLIFWYIVWAFICLQCYELSSHFEEIHMESNFGQPLASEYGLQIAGSQKQGPSDSPARKWSFTAITNSANNPNVFGNRFFPIWTTGWEHRSDDTLSMALYFLKRRSISLASDFWL